MNVIGKRKWGADSKSCFSIHGNSLDKAIVKIVLEVMEPAQIEVALKTFVELWNNEVTC